MDIDKPLFSVIVPVYNNEKLISKCIDSILKQTLNDFELIIINDGSTDNTKSICEKYAKQNNKVVFITQENKGVSAARNTGLLNAKGTWCVFVDSDDTLKENHLEELSRTESDITWIGYDMYDENNNLILHRIVNTINANTKDSLNHSIFTVCNERNFFAIIWTKKFKMEIIRKYNIKFDESITICEDILFTHEYLSHVKSLSCIKNATYNYTDRQGSLSHGGTNIMQYFDFVKKYCIFINKCTYEEKLKLLLKHDLENRFTYIMQKLFKPFTKFPKQFKKDVIVFGIQLKYKMNYKNGYIISKNVSLANFLCYFMWWLFYFPRKIKNIILKFSSSN